MEEAFDGGGCKLENRGARWIERFARLKPGVTIAQAQAEVSAVAARLENDFPATKRAQSIQLPLVVASFVLLIACANVGNLLRVKSFARRHEMTVRLSFGRGRLRLLRQLLTEGLILSVLAAGGVLVSNWCRNLMVLFYPPRPGVIVNLPSEIDWRVLAQSTGVCDPAVRANSCHSGRQDRSGIVDEGRRGRPWC